MAYDDQNIFAKMSIEEWAAFKQMHGRQNEEPQEKVEKEEASGLINTVREKPMPVIRNLEDKSEDSGTPRGDQVMEPSPQQLMRDQWKKAKQLSAPYAHY